MSLLGQQESGCERSRERARETGLPRGRKAGPPRRGDSRYWRVAEGSHRVLEGLWSVHSGYWKGRSAYVHSARVRVTGRAGVTDRGRAGEPSETPQ